MLDFFYSVQIMRPPATRKTSTEVYFVCNSNFMGDEIGDDKRRVAQIEEFDEDFESEFDVLQRGLAEEVDEDQGDKKSP